jgi:ProP effector
VSAASKARYEAAIAVLQLLHERFPAAFATFGAPRRAPLKIGVHADILANISEVDPRDLGNALSLWCSAPKYLRALTTAGAERIDLDGKPCGFVTEGEAESARERLKKLLAQRAAKASPPPVTLVVSTKARTSSRLTLNDLRAAAARRRAEGVPATKGE